MEFNVCNSDNVFYSDWYGSNEYTWFGNRLCGDTYTRGDTCMLLCFKDTDVRRKYVALEKLQVSVEVK